MIEGRTSVYHISTGREPRASPCIPLQAPTQPSDSWCTAEAVRAMEPAREASESAPTRLWGHVRGWVARYTIRHQHHLISRPRALIGSDAARHRAYHSVE